MRDFHNKTFPWPVLRPGVDDYVRGEFRSAIDLSVEEDASAVTLTVNFVIDRNDKLLGLVDAEDGKALYCVTVSCPRTFYREAFLTRNRRMQHIFKRGILSDKVVVSPSLIASGKIRAFASLSFNKEYGDARFNLDPGSVLALRPPEAYYVDMTLFRLGSVFRLDTREGVRDGNFEHEIHDSEFIIIYMSDSDLARFQAIRSGGDVVAMKKLFAGVYLPVLVAVLYDFDKDPSQYEDLRWARALKSRLNELGLRPPGEGENRLGDAQRILGNSFGGILGLED